MRIRLFKNLKGWNSWFAWYPVMATNAEDETILVFRERVMQQGAHGEYITVDRWNQAKLTDNSPWGGHKPPAS